MVDVNLHYIAKHDKLVHCLGIKLESVSTDYARVSMPLTENHLNGMGNAHGGAIFALADVAFGAAANAECKYGVVNMTSSIEFLRPGKVGPLMAEARIIRAGHHVVSYDVQVFDAEGNMIARAMISGYVTDQPLPE